MCGQRMTIRIVTAESLETQRINRYRYEVMSRRSPFYRCVDFAFSDNPFESVADWPIKFADELPPTARVARGDPRPRLPALGQEMDDVVGDVPGVGSRRLGDAASCALVG